jgi:CheY-like chemotaxis protein
LRPEIVDLGSYLSTLRDVLQRLVRSDIMVATAISAEIWPVRVDPSQLEAAILNLAVNARDAMPRGGHLTLEARNVTLSGDPQHDEPAGDFVALSIRDTGTGIPPQYLEKVFEPFFTTKEVGKGSGLGLSMVHGFVRQSAGSVSINSVVGEGTTITLYLPRTREMLATTAPAPNRIDIGQGTVLLVDDDPDVSAVTVEMLDSLGYSVLEAHDATEAIQLYETAERVSVLVTDLVLPDGMDGLELARTLRQRRPELPLVLITGYSEALAGYEDICGAVVLSKPYRSQALAKAMDRAIRASSEHFSRLLNSSSQLSLTNASGLI